MITMLGEKHRLDVARDRLLVHILNGGELPEIDGDDDSNGVAGIDYPVSASNVDWLNRRQ